MGGDLEPIGSIELRSALGWWLEAGVDVATAEEPRNWLKPSSFAASPPEVQTAPIPEARATGTLPECYAAFRQWLRETPDLPFASHGARKVLPVGPTDAPIMLLADMPALDCDADDGPIRGEAWTLLTRMLAAIGVDPAEAYRASFSCFHTPVGMRPGPELNACADIARRHVSLVKPRMLLLLGDGPCRALLGKALAAARGQVHKIEGVRAVATFHPSFLIMHPLQKEAAWSDLLLLTEEQ